jgi:hypothetical protein
MWHSKYIIIIIIIIIIINQCIFNGCSVLVIMIINMMSYTFST